MASNFIVVGTTNISYDNVLYVIHKKSLKIPNRQLEAVTRKGADKWSKEKGQKDKQCGHTKHYTENKDWV